MSEKQKLNVNKQVRREQPGLNGLVATGHSKGMLGISGLADPVYVDKRWGWELIHVNNPLYCCKTLHIKKGMHTSMHFHIEKHETLMPIEGTLYIDYVNAEKTISTIEVPQGQAFVMAPGLPHSLRAADSSVTLIEASTTSNDNDSIRLPEDLCHARQ